MNSVLHAVYDKVPPPNHFEGRDKITIHEDTDGDGVFDKHTTEKGYKRDIHHS